LLGELESVVYLDPKVTDCALQFSIERIKLRRRVIELSVQTRLGGAAAFTQQRPLIARYARPAGAALAKTARLS
jgi:hypothetical protein